MTIRTDVLLTWFHQPLLKNPVQVNVMTNRSSTMRTTDVPRRQYRIHVQRTCYRCQQEGHYAKNCPYATAPKPTETRMEKMQSLLQSMTPNERAEFKREISPQMTMMQAHLRTMTMSERMEFRRQITPNATQVFVTALKNKKAPTNLLSRETSPHTNQIFTGSLLSRETGPHPNKSVKKLAQALKKRAKYEAEQRVHTPDFNQSFEVLTKALKSPTKTSHPNQSMKTLADTLRRHTKRKDKTSTCTYAERIHRPIGPPELCKECGGEHPTRLCMK